MINKDTDSSSGNEGTPKKKVLNLNLLSRPPTAVQTSIATLFLYDLRSSDFPALQALPKAEPSSRIRAFVPHVASMVEAKGATDERPPLEPEEVSRLTDDDVNVVADAYANLLLCAPRVIGDETEKPERKVAEPATTYLDRLLRHEVESYSQQSRNVHEKLLASTNGVFDQVRKSFSTLGSTLSDYERLTNRSAPIEIPIPKMEHLHAMSEQLARQERDRADELEMVRLTGKMTAESAKTLKDLAEAATILLEQLDERDRKADQSTQKQMTIAVWSVGISAVLALLALIVSGLAYFQDRKNSESGDKWQSELIAAVREGNLQRATIEVEAQQLRNRISVLEAKIKSVEPSRPTALSTATRHRTAPSD